MKRDPIIAIAAAGFAGVVLMAAFAVASGRDAIEEPKREAVATAAALEEPAFVSTAEADAWAAARAADTKAAYDVYLAAFPKGAFAEEARAARDVAAAPRREAAARPAVQRISAPAEPSRRQIAAACRAYVDARLTQPSRTVRTVGGAAAGCAAGALAGGDDGRNCAVGAVVGGVAGAVSAESRERRRLQEVQYCIANGGPPA